MTYDLSLKRRIATFGLGMTLYGIFNWVFNNPIYMIAVGYYGVVKGGLVMMGLSYVQCLLLLGVYDKMGVDWVGVGYLDELRIKSKLTRGERIILWTIRRGGNWTVPRFIVLNILADPFIVAVHFRQRQFAGITRQDVCVLSLSVLTSNLYWIIRTGTLVLVIKWVWQSI
jgi:hypothetical protein